jgi:PIN domain nuclease of toxin-antitoxin system
LTLILGEPNGEKVRGILTDEPMTAVNLGEVVGHFALTADRAWQRIGRAVGVEIELIRGDPH